MAGVWNLPFIDLRTHPPDEALCDANDIDLYLAHLFLPWRRVASVPVIVCADITPRTRRAIAMRYGPRAVVTVTSKSDIVDTVQRLFHRTLTHDAIYRLDEKCPEFSARRSLSRAHTVVAAILAVAAIAGIFAAPLTLAWALMIFLSLVYSANIVLRLILFCAAASPGRSGHRVEPEELAALNTRNLPVYSILVPLYHEAAIIGQLVDSLHMLDYPPAKLDIKLILEEDDNETLSAIEDLRLEGQFEVIRVPPSLPRTKPKACNYGLRFARGEYVVIYDAEDRPQSDQLKKALITFRGAPRNVACVQARLNFYNANENWLTRMFALEYAAWFDFLLPGLDRLGVPIPLGGTSNHFRTEMLRALHGWDAFNVTEDADLGIRLARLGYRVLPLDSSTYEEAIRSFDGWIRQRSRWLKGYMCTALVHLRTPRAFVRAVGWGPFCGFVVFVGGATVASLLAPVLWAVSLALAWLDTGTPVAAEFTVAEASILNMVIANGILTALAVLAPLKRRWFHLAPYGVTVFAYWLLISLAAYKAFGQLITRPFYWEKTSHGLQPGGASRAPGRRARHARRARRALFVGAIVLLLSAMDLRAVEANPWIKERGSGEAIVKYTTAQVSSGLSPGGRAADAAADIHFEYGLSDRATLVMKANVVYDARAGTRVQRGAHFDTAWTGLRVNLRRWDHSVLAAEATTGMARTYATVTGNPIVTNGVAQARLLFGRDFTLANRHSFAAVEAGWRWRGGAPADEAIFDLTTGIAPWQSALLMLQSFSVVSTGQAHAPYRRYDAHKIQLSLAQNLGGKMWLQGGLMRNIGGADAGKTAVILALWWQF